MTRLWSSTLKPQARLVDRGQVYFVEQAALISSCGLSALQQAADGMFLGACGSEQAFVSNATRSDVLILVALPRGAQLWKSAAVMDGGKPHFRQSE